MAQTRDEQAVSQPNTSRKRFALNLAAFILAILAALLFINGFFWNSQRQTSLPTTIAPAQDTVTDVLLVMSYNESEANTPLARNGVLDVMSRSKVGVDVVYMDAYNAPLGSDAYNRWVSQLAQKVAQHGSYGAVICADDEALYFIEQNHDSMFGATPVVFFGVNDFNHALQAGTTGYMTGAVEQSYYGSVMQAALNLQPEATGFVAIVDETPAGVGNKGQFELAMKNFSGKYVRYIDASKMSRDQLATAISQVGSDSIIFLLDASNDIYGNYYPLTQTASYVSSASNAPVYRATMGGVGNGIAGSGFLDPASDGQKAAETTIQVLNGTRPADIAVSFDGNLGYVYDARVLNSYGISTASVPAGSAVVNRSILSLDTLRLVVLPLILLIIAVLFLSRSRKLVAQSAAAQENLTNYQVETVEAREVTSPGAKRKSRKQLASSKSKRKNKKIKPRKAPEKEEIEVESIVENEVVEVDDVVGASDAYDADDVVEEELEVLEQADEHEDAVYLQEEELESQDADDDDGPSISYAYANHAALSVDDSEVNRPPEPTKETPKAERPVKSKTTSSKLNSNQVPPQKRERGGVRTLRQRHVEPRSLIALEVTNLSYIEDLHGSRMVEECLQVIHQRLEGMESALYVRKHGKNGFLVGLEHSVDRGSQEIEFVEFLLRQPLSIEDYSISLQTCVSAVNRQKNMTTDEMEEGAWFAIEQSKELGRFDSVVFCDSDMRTAMEDRNQITELLEQAIAAEDFMVFYQPQVSLSDNTVSGYEALVRLKDKKYPPSQFIPIAEMNGMIIDIDRIVTKRAVEQLSKWKRRNKRMRPISINLSAVHLTQEDDYAAYLLGVLSEYGVSPSYVRIEITETFFNTDQKKAEELITSLFQSGITIALDRFGKGFTSFSDIMSIPASVVKIDKEFVDTFLVDGSDENFEQLVLLAQGFGKRVVVVGVDNKFQLDTCRKLKCDAVQGYYFSKPLLPENAVQYKPK